MLLVSLLLLVVGFTLMYAGLKAGTGWKKPWDPFATYLKASG